MGPATAKKLIDAGYATVESVAVATAHELMQLGIGYDVALRISQSAREMVKIELVTADEVFKRR